MGKLIIEAIDYIEQAIDKSKEFADFKTDFSKRVLDNRILTIEAYTKYIDQESIPKLKKLSKMFEVENNG